MSVISSPLKDEQNLETTNPLEYLQALENDQYGGNFLFAVVNQLALNNTLKMLNIYSSLSLWNSGWAMILYTSFIDIFSFPDGIFLNRFALKLMSISSIGFP